MFTCCVPGCFNTTKTHSLHRFPQQQDLRQQWLVAINRKASNSDYKLFKPTLGHRVCSAHFTDGKKQSPDAVPCIFTNRPVSNRPTPNVRKRVRRIDDNATAKASSRKPRSDRLANKSVTPPPPDERSSSLTQLPMSPTSLKQRMIKTGLVIPPVAVTVQVNTAKPSHRKTRITFQKTPDHTYARHPSDKPYSPSKRDLSAKVRNAASEIFTLQRRLSTVSTELRSVKKRILDSDALCKDSTKLNLYTGFSKPDHYQALLEFLRPDESMIKYPSSQGLQFTNKLSFENSILLTLVKYKLDTPQEDLAFR